MVVTAEVCATGWAANNAADNSFVGCDTETRVDPRNDPQTQIRKVGSSRESKKEWTKREKKTN